MKTIFVIDDDVDIREIISFSLENDGFHVFSFENGKVALEALKNTEPDKLPGLLIVDYLMPEMDGLTFLQELRDNKDELLSKIPVAISSAMGGIDTDALNKKDVKLLKKPMDLEDLLEVARSYCS